MSTSCDQKSVLLFLHDKRRRHKRQVSAYLGCFLWHRYFNALTAVILLYSMQWLHFYSIAHDFAAEMESWVDARPASLFSLFPGKDWDTRPPRFIFPTFSFLLSPIVSTSTTSNKICRQKLLRLWYKLTFLLSIYLLSCPTNSADSSLLLCMFWVIGGKERTQRSNCKFVSYTLMLKSFCGFQVKDIAFCSDKGVLCSSGVAISRCNRKK